MAKVYFDAPLAESFDTYQHQALTAGRQYDALDCADTAYYAAWKLAQAGKTFKLTATLVQGTYMPCPLDSVKFARSDGTLLPFTRQGNVFTIQATGRMHLYADAVWSIANYALNKESKPERWILGKLNIINTDIKKMNVVLVPVNGIGAAADVERLKKALSLNYANYNLAVDIQKHQGITIEELDAKKDRIKIDRNLLNTKYNQDIYYFLNTFLANDSFKANTQYFFLWPFADKEEIDGYMSLFGQFGFIFLKNSQTINAVTFAHELGHGAMGLDHTFENDESKSGKSLNIMDYSQGKYFNYNQWLNIFDNYRIKDKLKSIFQDEDEGLRSITLTNNLNSILQNKYKKFVFLTPNGSKIVLPKEAHYAEFNDFDEISRTVNFKFIKFLSKFIIKWPKIDKPKKEDDYTIYTFDYNENNGKYYYYLFSTLKCNRGKSNFFFERKA